jgi:UDPglucose 6-dehydrogenase
MLATRISFMNELAKTCEKVGANIHSVRVGMGSDSRIGYHFLYAGIGWGGSCFPKDIRALMELAKDNNCPSSILQAVYDVNQAQKTLLVDKMLKYFDQDLTGKVIALWGLSFKPDTDDIREAPSLEIINQLLKQGAIIKAFDPVCSQLVKEIYPQIDICHDPYHAAQNADATALLTEWKQFRSIDFKKLRTFTKGTVFFDGRNQFNPQIVEQAGFDYIGIGQGSKKSCAASLA